ncbi:70 kDa peptidyl-prolyl isomerase [Morus notabilis]|uniref:70 kDa peptidyl-prolyl isomerase n=1 Tax=Morus notabilis TaxID=981085 RepID=UPI000CED55CB|nr:70 kDa peptidyl-prolyl isomerase [Morus notabilis]
MASSESKPCWKTKTEDKNPTQQEKEIRKQGLKKQILRNGSSWQTPSRGDEVQVHFSGRIKGGACLDQSRDIGTPFKFKLGQCEVIKGLDEGVATMKKGERAIFTIPPNLAYGEVGNPPLIPPNSTLVYDIEMISWRTIRDITGDGGILKKIIKEGEGWATPRDGDEVLVKYKSSLENGMLVSESDNTEFYISDDYICPAISRTVKTMRRGEKAELAVKSSYSFKEVVNGTATMGVIAPLASNLTIEIELISWKSVVDVTGDKKVVKKIIKPGEGFDHPNEGAIVKVIYTGTLEDGSEFESKGSEEEPYEFVCLEEQVNEGLDRAIMTMKKGEQALVTVGAEFLPSFDASRMVATGSLVYYRVQLIEFTKEKPFWKMDTSEKLEFCERKKHDGNLLFKAGKFWCASKKYEKENYLIEFDHSFTDDEKYQAQTLWLSCQLNNAACKLKMDEFLQASKLCTKVLEVDPFNIKALYRRSQAYLRISELEKAEEDIRRALRIDPNNRDVKLVHKELKDKQMEYVKYQSEIFSSMLAKMAN